MSTTTPTTYDLSGDFEMVFPVEAGAWTPRPDVYSAAVEAALATGSLIPSNQAVYAAIRARGFKEAKINGRVGFRDIAVGDSSIKRSRREVQRHRAVAANPSPWFVSRDAADDDHPSW